MPAATATGIDDRRQPPASAIRYVRRRRSAAKPSSALPSKMSVAGSGTPMVKEKTNGSIE